MPALVELISILTAVFALGSRSEKSDVVRQFLGEAGDGVYVAEGGADS